MLDPSILEDQATRQSKRMTRGETEFAKDLHTRPVTATDLMRVPGGANDEALFYNLIWLAGHVATAEVLQRIYLSQVVTQQSLSSSLSTVIGRKVDSPSLHLLQGADGALFWLVVVAARTVSLLGIMDCSNWLTSHLLDSALSSDTLTLTPDSLDESADRFLRGLAMANLLALAFHFYRPDQAPAEDFYFNFGVGGELEPAASHHNARLVANLCRGRKELHSFLSLMPAACTGSGKEPNDSQNSNTDLHHVNLIGFCSQGLARSPAHRRLHNASLAAELYQWFTRDIPDRQIPPLKVKGIKSSGTPNELQKTVPEAKTYPEQPMPRSENHLLEENKRTLEVPNGVDRRSPPGSDPSYSSAGGRGTYRLDSTTISDESNTPSGGQVALDGRLGKENFSAESLQNRLDELSTSCLIHSTEGGVYLPPAKCNKSTVQSGETRCQDNGNRINTKAFHEPNHDPLQRMFFKNPQPFVYSGEIVEPQGSHRSRARSSVVTRRPDRHDAPGRDVDRYHEPFAVAQPVNRTRDHIRVRPKISRPNSRLSGDILGTSELTDASRYNGDGAHNHGCLPVGLMQDLLPDSLNDRVEHDERADDDTDCEQDYYDHGAFQMLEDVRRPHRTSAPAGRRSRNQILRETGTLSARTAQPRHPHGSGRSRSQISHYNLYPPDAFHSTAGANPCMVPVFYPVESTAGQFVQSAFAYNSTPSAYHHPRATWDRPSVVPTMIAGPNGCGCFTNPVFLATEHKDVSSFASTDQMCQTNEAVEETQTLRGPTSHDSPLITTEKIPPGDQTSSPNAGVDAISSDPKPEQKEANGSRIQSFFIPFDSGRPPVPIHTLPRALSRTRKQLLKHSNSQEEQSFGTLLDARTTLSAKMSKAIGNKLTALPPNGLLPSKTSLAETATKDVRSIPGSKMPHQTSASNALSPSGTTATNGADVSSDDKALDAKDQLERREKKRELEKQRREMIFQAYLNRKCNVSSDKEGQSDQSRPSSGASQKNQSNSQEKTDKSEVRIPRRTSSIPRRKNVASARSAREPQTQDDGALLSDRADKISEFVNGMNAADTKLFVQLQSKSNRRVIANALSHCCLAGPVNLEAKQTALTALGCSDGKHFIVLLRSHCQYSGLYSFSAADDVGVRISGLGPKRIDNSLVERFYKYDSGSKRFTEITSTSHLSTVVDAVMLKGKTRNRFPSASPNI
ncbi:hypothetical protein CSKR_109513 [Clonorchis sinensis]|uniref:Uncharacterized protein n=1 Tax=Clonorchis sinensis TaxID=79923 RepID=A0A3R7ET25_CLOSI|nr:hypothetical protein CSKR_109513 [Clonorchis sinensis]